MIPVSRSAELRDASQTSTRTTKRGEKHVSTEINPTTGLRVDLLGPTMEFLTSPQEASIDFCVLRGVIPSPCFIDLKTREIAPWFCHAWHHRNTCVSRTCPAPIPSWPACTWDAPVAVPDGIANNVSLDCPCPAYTQQSNQENLPFTGSLIAGRLFQNSASRTLRRF